jgi:aryl-alcohol dehydrogenase-like predicted oxidoreductase
MKKNTLGSSELEVPVICLGTMTWGQQNTEEEAHAQLDYAVNERGINFIDTAEVYPIPPEKNKQGLTERYIGTWLAKRGKRDDLILASKVCIADGLLQTRDTSDIHFDKKNIMDALDGSLSRLQTEYLDLYQIHWPERKTNFFGQRGYVHDSAHISTSIRETVEVLSELVLSGKVRHIGISNETPWGMSEFIRVAREYDLPLITSIQNQYSLTNRTFEIGLAEMSLRENIPLLAYSVLNMGALTGKYLDGAKPAGARFSLSDRGSERYNPPEAQNAIREYIAVAEKHNMDIVTMAIAYVCSRDFVASVIIGATNMDQLKLSIDAGEVELSAETISDIEEVYKKYPDVTS